MWGASLLVCWIESTRQWSRTNMAQLWSRMEQDTAPRPKHIPSLAPLRAPGQAGNVCTSPLLSLQSKSYLNQITKYPDAVLLMPPFVCSVFASFAFLHHFSRGLCPFFPAHLRCWFRSHTFHADSDIDDANIFYISREHLLLFRLSLIHWVLFLSHLCK